MDTYRQASCNSRSEGVGQWEMNWHVIDVTERATSEGGHVFTQLTLRLTFWLVSVQKTGEGRKRTAEMIDIEKTASIINRQTHEHWLPCGATIDCDTVG